MSFTSDPMTKHPGMRAIQNSRASVCAPERETFSFKSSCGMTGKLLSPSLSPSFLPSLLLRLLVRRPLVLVSAGVFGPPGLIGRPGPDSLRSRQTKPGRGGMFRRGSGHPATAGGAAKIADPSPLLTAFFFNLQFCRRLRPEKVVKYKIALS